MARKLGREEYWGVECKANLTELHWNNMIWNLNNQIKEVKANYDDIYLIKRYKATFINLYYYEVFYTQNDVIKKIVVSISLAPNLEKKIKKKIKLIKEELPKTKLGKLRRFKLAELFNDEAVIKKDFILRLFNVSKV